MVKITEEYVPVDGFYRSGTKLRRFRGVTVHETDNYARNSGARAQKEFFHNRVQTPEGRQVSYHYFVDDKEAFLVIPSDEVAWINADGEDGSGNNETVSVSICTNPESDFSAAVDNACGIIATELKKHEMKRVLDGMADRDLGNIFQHYSWSKKDCPKQIRAGRIKWDYILSKTQHELDRLWQLEQAAKPTGNRRR